MATLTCGGKPNNNTVAAVGDIYIDISTGKQYKCVFAYRVGDEVQRKWRDIEGLVVPEIPEVPEVPTISKVYEVPEIPELPISKTVEQSNRTRYSNYSKPNKSNKH